VKKQTPKKLTLPKETVRQLQVPNLEEVAGGATLTCLCDSCGNNHSTCPV
jgi:hypothetical protein